MNICVLTHTFPRSKEDSTAAFMKPFVEGLVEAGNKVILLTPYVDNFVNNSKLYKVIKYKYVWPDNWHKLGYSRTMKADVDLKIFNYLLMPLMFLFGTISLIKVIKKYKIDVINVHWIIPNGLLAFVTSKILNIPYIITVPGTDTYLIYRSKFIAMLARIVANSSSGIVSNSKLLLKRIIDLGIKNIPVKIISYPVDISKFKLSKLGLDMLRKKLKVTEKNLIILAIGRLVYKKGFSYLIKAMSKTIKIHPNAKLIIGGDGDLLQSLKLMTNKLNLSKSVLFVGNIDRNETDKYYNLSDIFVASSIIDKKGNVDGGPVVSYESMACGKAQIATDILGVASIIKNGVNGYVVKQKNIVELADAIKKLLTSKSKREKMGIRNRNLIRNLLNTKSIGLEYTKFINKVLKNEK